MSDDCLVTFIQRVGKQAYRRELTKEEVERWAKVGAEQQSLPPISPKAPSDPVDGPEVGLTQKGTDADAVVKRETEV